MLAKDGQVAVSDRSLAWTVAGTNLSENLTDSPMTASEALDLSGLTGWNVRHVPLSTGLGDHATAMDDLGVTMPNHRAVLATIDGKPQPLGVVGNRHHLIQNEETADLLDTIVDEGGAHFVAAGSLDNCRRTFVVMKMPKDILIGGEDASDLYFGCTNSHDGTGSLVAWTTAMRLACTNMLNSSMKGAQSKWTLRHTSSIRGKVEDARRSLNLTFAWADDFQTKANRMLDTEMTNAMFERMIDRLAPPSDSDKAGWVARAEDKRSALRHLFREAETNAFGRGTRWAAYNAFTEYADWYMPIRSKDPVDRASRNLLGGAVTQLKQDAFDLLTSA